MKRLFCLVSILTFLSISIVYGQDVAVHYDAGLENGNGLAVQNPAQLADLIVEELKDKKLNAEIVDSDGLAEYMNANKNGIYVITQGNTPGTIFQKKGKDILVYQWLREGGIGGFIGDYAFYYYWHKGARVTAAAAGQQSVFGATITNGTVSQVEPTELGKKYIPSLKKWTSNRAAGLAVLNQNDFEFESYADDGTNADPIAYRTEDMKGWFINFHTSCCGTQIPPNEQIATEYAELISNRFAVAQAVDPNRIISTIWGLLKSQ
ncbi:hypothetical protein JT359_16915 [Candidatus Poribacteria bacterium]|nr:hypothetical protein [Candidatus Poribacteria bacterium]